MVALSSFFPYSCLVSAICLKHGTPYCRCLCVLYVPPSQPAGLLLEPANNVEAGGVRRINTFSWTRSSKQGSGKASTDKGLKETRRYAHSNVEMACGGEESGAVVPSEHDSRVEPLDSGASHKKKSPSISIEPESNLELSLDLTVSQMAVETEDTLTARALGSNDTREGVIVYSDDESLDGDLPPVETGKERAQEEEVTQLHKDEKQMDEKEGATADQPLEQVSESEQCL